MNHPIEPALIACPFCGGDSLKALTHAVVCLGCDATGPMPKTALAVRPSMGQVIRAWNTRIGRGDGYDLTSAQRDVIRKTANEIIRLIDGLEEKGGE